MDEQPIQIGAEAPEPETEPNAESDPVVTSAARVVALAPLIEQPSTERPGREKKLRPVKEVKPPREPKVKEVKPPREPKVKEVKPPREPKPAPEPKVKAPKAVKPPKEPKPPKTPKPPRVRSESQGAALALSAGIIGSVGLLLSVILAVGALFIALDAAQGSGFFTLLSDLCDFLVGPLKDVFHFTGLNANKKESLVGWGLGSMGYLLVGRFLQSVLQSRVKS
ncbi:MAG: hypothetical protein ABIR57_10160 [Aeromicrobium sp.]